MDELFEKYMHPIWEGNVVFAESVMFYPEPQTGIVEPAPLLYRAEEIFSITSSDFMIEYKENEDYYLENGKLVRTKNSAIPVWDYDSYYLKEPAKIPIYSASVPDRYVHFAPGGKYHSMQVAVTYRHNGETGMFRPQRAENSLYRSLKKLRLGQPLKIVFFGDSLVEGCDASGHCQCAPYMPPFTELIVRWLRERFPQSDIRAVNTAVGGTDSGWGAEQAQQRIADHRPDLVLLNFGMNDSGHQILPRKYKENMQRIIDTVRNTTPEAEFLMLTTYLPNPDCAGWTCWQKQYRPIQQELASENAGIVLCNTGQLQDRILQHKRYADMAGNGVNHPNDFLSRIYAQAIADTMSR